MRKILSFKETLSSVKWRVFSTRDKTMEKALWGYQSQPRTGFVHLSLLHRKENFSKDCVSHNHAEMGEDVITH